MLLQQSTRAFKLQKRAARVGFDWESADAALLKLKEELSEVEAEMDKNREENHDRMEEELGDLMFSVINVARKLKVDPDTALRNANRKFENRFAFIESELAKKGLTPAEAGLMQMEELWEKSKKSV
ncbi:MAG: hypothetical protein IKD08_03910 [Alphaproteobacteria bacterium]|nr:hypothetical protein [Alphaproteobacteria bacterium]